MKKLLMLALTLACVSRGFAAATINATNKSAYGANIGWLDWRGDTNNGAVIGEYICSGYIYSANVGWINLGSGTPTNGIQYQNVATNDFGVNHDGLGNLRGTAYGANIGWINFETNGRAKVNLNNGCLSGSIYSANCGWISLSNAMAFVQTDSIRDGADSDDDGIADAWERLKFGNLATATASSDFDDDGASDAAEYLADTNPMNDTDYLRILSHTVSFKNGLDTDTLDWTSRPSRQYRINYRTALVPVTPWLDTGLLFNPTAGTNTVHGVVFGSPSSERYLRVQAVKPLP